MNPIGDPYFDQLISRVYKEDKDAVVVHAGERGSTKTGDGITTGEILDLDKNGVCRFKLPHELVPKQLRYILRKGYEFPRLVFKPSDFLKIISNPLLPPGSVIIWDETGVEGDARDFASKKNKFLKRTMETIRSRNLIVILTAPTLMSFDIGFRRSMTYFVECKGAVELDDGKYGKTRIYETQTNPKSGKTYFKKIRVYGEDGKGYMLNNYYFPKPSWQLERPYKKYKKLFQTKLWRDYANELDSMDELVMPEEDREKTLKSMVSMACQTPKKYFDAAKHKFSVPALMEKFDVNYRRAFEVKQVLDFRLKQGVITVA